MRLDELQDRMRLRGFVPDRDVTVVAIERHGYDSATVTYRDSDGRLGERVVTSEDLLPVREASELRWSFDADGAMFRLASEARRMRSAHLADPFAAVDTSNIDPYPHQIEAVYQTLLEQRPIRYLLADDPGAGKTIMSGLLIRELMLRGDVARCLIVAPGSLVEQWQDELYEKFGLDFELMSRAKVEESRAGNPFIERNLMIARLDQLARADDLRAKLEMAEWDLVIVDEAHKMSARLDGDKLNRTKRFQLGEVLRERARHLLLLSATPHNGKNEDFLAFLTLLDAERFAGRLRNGTVPNIDDVFRRRVKESLLTFEGKPLFPPRTAESINYELSEPEQALYEAVTTYVKHGMNRADELKEGGDKRRGLMVGFALAGLQRRLASSPAAIHESLRRRTERLRIQCDGLRKLAKSGDPVPVAELPKGVRVADLEEFDYDEYGDDELEALEDAVIDAATAAATADELEAELVELDELVRIAAQVRASGQDTKWVELRGLLRSERFRDTDPPRKLIIFSEHRDTLNYVTDRVRDELGREEAVVTIHGGMRREDRRSVQDRFRVDPEVRVLVATDAAGEGVNLQVANLMVNYDLPWNPNRIEQRFGRIHRIGQPLPCHLWNLVAHETREGMVFERLFEKIEEQRGVYGDQVYDVLGDPQMNVRLQDLLIRAIREDEEAVRLRIMDEIIDGQIGSQLEDVLRERALVNGLADIKNNDQIRVLMERSRARRLQPWFVEAFFTHALQMYGGRITGRDAGRFEITRVPASVRQNANPMLGPVHERYHRVTFDARHVRPEGMERAELISPGTPLLTSVVDKVLADHGHTLTRGATLVDPSANDDRPRLLVYLEHTLTDGREHNGHRQVISRRFQYVEIDPDGNVSDPGPEPYLGYSPITSDQHTVIAAELDRAWADTAAERSARDWAIAHLASPHFAEVDVIAKERVAKVRAAVRERLETEIRHWDQRTEEIKAQELAGKTPKLNSGRARARADELAARLDRRMKELALEEDVHNSPPTVVGAALIIPQLLLDRLMGEAQPQPDLTPDTAETDRRAVAAVMKAERSIGRMPEEQPHNNPGFDIESVDPKTGIHYFIEVKGHLPRTTEIKVSAQQVQKAKSNPERWRLVIVSVPDEPAQDPVVNYLIDPFRDTHMHFAQTHVPLNIAAVLPHAGAPK